MKGSVRRGPVVFVWYPVGRMWLTVVSDRLNSTAIREWGSWRVSLLHPEICCAACPKTYKGSPSVRVHRRPWDWSLPGLAAAANLAD